MSRRLFCSVGVVLYWHGYIDKPGDVLIVLFTTLQGSYFLALLGPNMMVVVKARIAAAILYEVIDEVKIVLVPNFVVVSKRRCGENCSQQCGRMEGTCGVHERAFHLSHPATNSSSKLLPLRRTRRSCSARRIVRLWEEHCGWCTR